MGLMPFVLAAAVVTGPMTGGDHGQPFSAMLPAELTQAGYTEAEYFFGGTATAFKPVGPPGADGLWNVAPDTTADYKVRMLVRRPAESEPDHERPRSWPREPHTVRRPAILK